MNNLSKILQNNAKMIMLKMKNKIKIQIKML